MAKSVLITSASRGIGRGHEQSARSTRRRASGRFSSTLVAASAVLVGCGDDEAEVATSLARPVTVIELREAAAPSGKLIPGVVTAYRETQVPFEVAGRVESLIDVGDDVQAWQVDQEGQTLQAGTVIATLDPAPFERALNKANQRLVSARAQLDAQIVQLEQVLPARLRSAQSQAAAAELNATYARNDVEAQESAVKLAETTLERNQELLPTGAVSDIAVRQSATELQAQQSRLAQSRTLVTAREREHDSAVAAISEVEGAISLQQASNEALAADIKGLEEAVKDAESDLEDCVLRAPFPGRVTQMHVGEGSFVQAGAPIITLTMMNPIEAVIAVSSVVEEQLVVGTDALIYPMNGSAVDLGQSVRATLYQKRGVANSGTRTFEVGLIAPNERRVSQDGSDDLPSAPYVIPIFENPLARPGGDGLFTVDEAINRDGERPWVLRVRGLSQGARTAETLRGTLQAERVVVELGAGTTQVASFKLVELLGPDTLNPGDLLVPMPTPAHESGFVVDDNRWLLRPGDLVQVSVEHGSLPPGFYVPVQSIRERNGETHVFVVAENDVARSIAVEVQESSGELRRIVAAELAEGLELVSKGSHFLQDGDTVIRTGSEQ